MSGDLFVIHCTTCSSRLRVREVEAIGQILACPKCGSMVLVEPPPGFKLDGAPVVASAEVMSVRPATASKATGTSLTRETVSDSDFADAAALFDDPHKPAKPATPKSPAPKTAAPKTTSPTNAPPLVQAKALPTKTTTPPNDKRLAETTDAPNLVIAKPIPERLTSSKAVAEKQAAAKPEKQPPQAPPPPAELSTPAPHIPANSSATTAPAEIPLPMPEVVPPHVRRGRFIALFIATCIMGIVLAMGVAYLASGRRNVLAPQQAIANLPEETFESLPNKKEEPSELIEPKIETKVEKPEEPKTPDQPPPEVEKPMPPIEPPVKPPEIDITEKPVLNRKDPFKLDDLRKFDEINNNTPPPDKEVPPPLPTPPPLKPALPRPTPRKIDLAARLKDKIHKIEFENCALSDFLQGMSNFSTIPITLDPQALPWSRITPAHGIKTNLSDLTVMEVLRETLAPYRLEPVVVGETIVITRSATPKTIAYPISDLTKNDPSQITQLIAMLEALAAPESWVSAGGTGTSKPQADTLAITTTELAHTQVMELFERLRVARGQLPKSKLPPELFVMESRTQRAAKALAQPITLNFSQSTPLVKILQRLGREAEVQILVDWHALAEAGWPTDSETSIILEKISLADSLQKLLEPMDLAYRVIDAHTLQVTSLAALPKVRELEIYRAADLLGPEEDVPKLIERLQTQFGNSVAIRYDNSSECLFLLATQMQHEKLRHELKPSL